MKIKIFTDAEKDHYNVFVKENALDGGLLQSWQWGEFKKKQGLSLERLGVFSEKGDLMCAASVLTQSFAKLWKIQYIPRGPVLFLRAWDQLDQSQKVLDVLFSSLEKKARQTKMVFLRMDPAWTTVRYPRDWPSNLGFQRAKRSIQPEHTLVVNVEVSEQGLLDAMKQKTRYNVNLAERKGVTVRRQNDRTGVGIFLKLLQKTSNRHGIRSYRPVYYENLFEIFSEERGIEILIAKHQGVDIAASWLVRFGNTLYYLYGASDYQYRNIMAPYILHWESLKLAKRIGCRFYDFWGVKAREGTDSREKNWEGFSRFKMGFAPNQRITEYVGTWEKVYREKLYRYLGFLR